ncbi:LysR family transcriptional regulator [Clostridiales Family XIII bacterium WCA-MUC-591-APC-3H]|uniref:LysR family transcriptional regulator n=2 Tax=Hornefia butyriciproducens TaxID=2652293 RepID=A0A6L5Y696_9FIRM|nr:LysR family transcriptional regulator [Hornefia butyriciproducens]
MENEYMENKNVATFVKIVEFNNFTKAADSLGYSQAAVTAQIKSLEKELGVPLFDRVGKRIFLTQAGKTFLPYAIDLLKAEEAAKNSVGVSEELEGELVICSASSYASEVLPQILLRYMHLHPKVRITVKVSDYLEDNMHKLAQGELDFLLCMDERNAFPDFASFAEKPEPVIFVTHPSNPLLKKKRKPLQDVVTSNFIVSDREIGYSRLLEKQLQKKGIELSPIMEMGSTNAIINVLLGGYGTSFLPEYTVRKHIKDGTLARIDVKDINVDMYSFFLCSRDRWINPVMQAFIDIVNKSE